MTSEPRETETIVSYIVQGRIKDNRGTPDPWRDAAECSTLLSAIGVREELEAFHRGVSKLGELTRELYKAFEVKMEVRIIKRTAVVVDEVVDEAAVVLRAKAQPKKEVS